MILKYSPEFHPFPKVNVPNVGPPTIELKSIVTTYDKMALSTNQMLEASQPIREGAHFNNLKADLIDSTASRIVLGSTFERYANPIAIPPITTTRILLLRIPNSSFKILTRFLKVEILP